MADITTIVFPPSPTLAHSLNSRGELGMFVNPYTCSCVTCRNYIGADGARDEGEAEDYDGPVPAPTLGRSSSVYLPPPRPVGETDAAESLVRLSIAPPPPAALMRSYTGIGPTAGVAMDPWTPPETPSLRALGPTESIATEWAPSSRSAPASFLRFSMGSDPWRNSGALRMAPPPPSTPEKEEDGSVSLTAEEAATTAEALREYLAILRERQDHVYDGECRSHDEMAAQDVEFDEIDRKIMEIDEILATLEA
jgi:hypothetical protein